MKVIKRVICLFLSSALMLGIQPVLFAEALGIVVDTEEFFVYDSIRNDSIDNLMVDRSNLEVNLEENREEIERIDYKLDQLGVDVLSETEVESKLGVVSPNMDTPTIDGVRWTSRRQVVIYHGQRYELQIIEAIPNSTDSPLIEDKAACVYEEEGVVAGILNAARIVAVDTMSGVVDRYSTLDELKTGITVLNAFLSATAIVEGFRDSLTHSTVMDKVTGTALVSFSVHMRYIFAKPYDTLDVGNQLLCYVGNTVTYKITTTSAVWDMENGEPVAEHIVNQWNATTYSADFDDLSVPAMHYHNFKYYGIERFYMLYYIDSIMFNFFGTNVEFDVPIIKAYPY